MWSADEEGYDARGREDKKQENLDGQLKRF